MKFLLSSLLLICSLALHAESFKAISPERLLALQTQGVVVVDIRRAEEWQQTGVIKGSKLHTFFDKQRNFDLPKWEAQVGQYIKDKDSPIILVCRAANRTKTLARMLMKEGYTNLYELDKGIVYGWKNLGLATTPVSRLY